MFFLRYGPALAVAAAVITGAAWVWSLRAENERLEAQVVQQAQTISALERQRAQAREAAAVARANAEREAARAREYDALREAILTENFDVPLPDFFRDWLSDLGVGLRD